MRYFRDRNRRFVVCISQQELERNPGFETLIKRYSDQCGADTNGWTIYQIKVEHQDTLWENHLLLLGEMDAREYIFLGLLRNRIKDEIRGPHAHNLIRRIWGAFTDLQLGGLGEKAAERVSIKTYGDTIAIDHPYARDLIGRNAQRVRTVYEALEFHLRRPVYIKIA